MMMMMMMRMMMMIIMMMMEVSGEDAKLGMGTAEKEFQTIKSFTWTFGGTGSVKIQKVQDVTLNKTPKINLDIEECTGVFKCDNLATGSVSIKKANILYMHDTCKSKVQVDECNCLIILKDGSATEYTVGKVGLYLYLEQLHKTRQHFVCSAKTDTAV